MADITSECPADFIGIRTLDELPKNRGRLARKIHGRLADVEQTVEMT
jgi:hypothetical protein